MYKTERGTTVKTSGTPIVTTAKVGLMYASDYGYSVKNSSCNHSSKSLFDYSATACGGNAWMLKNGNEWTVSPYSGYAYSVFYVYNLAYADSGYGADYGFGARPVLYLNSNVYYLSGTGTITDPFQIALGN
ncbi:unknown [Clostridium sp. CAG:762]|nr:unknown [Clostridium sp. CAG:762]